MALTPISNGESGASARAKINAGFTATDAVTAATSYLTAGPLLSIFPAVASALSAGNRASILDLGDSTGRGWGSNGAPGGAGVAGDAANQRVPRSWVHQLSDMIKASGLASRSDALIGSGNTSANTAAEFMAANPTTVLGAGWSLIGTVSAGGRMLENSTDTTALTFTPEENANTFDIVYVQTTGYATFTVTDASGTLATINAAGSLSLIKTTVTRTTSSKLPISLQRNGTGTNLRLVGIIPYDTTEPMLELWNGGAGGFTTANWNTTSNGVSPGLAYVTLAPTQYVIELGANDANGAVADATFQSNLDAIVGRAIAVAPVSLIKPPQARDNSGSYNIPVGYLTAIDAIKAARPTMTATINFNSLPFNTNDYFDSSVHMTKSGYRKRAQYALSLMKV